MKARRKPPQPGLTSPHWTPLGARLLAEMGDEERDVQSIGRLVPRNFAWREALAWLEAQGYAEARREGPTWHWRAAGKGKAWLASEAGQEALRRVA